MLDELIKELCATEGEGSVDTTVDTGEVDTQVDVSDEGGQVQTEPTYTTEDIEKFRNGYESYNKQLEAYKQLEMQSKDALELYNYLNSNKDLAQKLYEFDKELQGGIQDKMPSKEREEMNSLRLEVEKMKIDKELNAIKSKDSSVDELELLTIANEHKVSLDLAYKIFKGSNFEKSLKQELDKQSKNLTNQIQQNGNVTKTLISEGDKANNDNASYGLSAMEVQYAEKLGMSAEEYSKWK